MGCICSNIRDKDDMIVLDPTTNIIPEASLMSRREKFNSYTGNKYISNNEEENVNKTSHDYLESKKSKSQIDIEIFPQQMLNEINLVRTNPSKYAEKIRKFIPNISKDDNNQQYFCADINAKINLPHGVKAFENCIEYLNNINPINELKLIEELRLNFPYKYPESAVKREYITQALLEMATLVKDKYSIHWFHYDNNICDAEISTILQIVDDNNSNGERRKHLLDENIKYVGINIGQVKENIYCIYLVFAK